MYVKLLKQLTAVVTVSLSTMLIRIIV